MEDDSYILGFLNGKGYITKDVDEAIQLWIGAQSLNELREYGIFKSNGAVDIKKARESIMRCAEEDKVKEDEED